MIEIGELIDFLVSIILIFYLMSLIKNKGNNFKSFWFLGILAIVLSKLFSLVESFVPFLNTLEHLSFLSACILITISIFKKELS